MSEFRRDPVIGRWVIIDNDNVYHPQDYEKEDNTPRHIAESPFIYGHEHLTPPEIDVIHSKGSDDWQVRVVPNKFPALAVEGNLDPQQVGNFELLNGIGAHEVIIETPDPAEQFADYSVQRIVDILTIYQRRYLDLTNDQRFKYIMIFKNFGASAGTSIEHAHSQLIALPMIPKYVQEKLDGAADFYKRRGRSIFVDMLNQEKEDQERIISENQDFISFCPFVPRFAFESCIFPQDCHSKFQELDEAKLVSLATLLKGVLLRLKICLSNPSFNFYLQLDPVNIEYEQSFLWHIEIVPKLTSVAEFDWDTGFYVVRTPPQLAAKYLRDINLQEYQLDVQTATV